jgi:hypothetical protein
MMSGLVAPGSVAAVRQASIRARRAMMADLRRVRGPESADPQRAVDLADRPGAGPGQAGAALRHRPLHELRLAARPVHGGHHPPGDLGGSLRPVVVAVQVQAQVDAGRDARAGQDLALIDVQGVGAEAHGGEPGGELAGVLPVGGGRPPVQQPGGGQGERPGAH